MEFDRGIRFEKSEIVYVNCYSRRQIVAAAAAAGTVADLVATEQVAGRRRPDTNRS